MLNDSVSLGGSLSILQVSLHRGKDTATNLVVTFFNRDIDIRKCTKMSDVKEVK